MSTDAPVITFQTSPLNFFRPPHWRHKTARQAIEDGMPLPIDDDALNEIHSFELAMDQVRCERDHRKVAQKWPGIAAAHQFANAAGPLRCEIEARILAAQDDAIIAARSGIDLETVRWFELTYFDVRGKLRASDWIRFWAIESSGQGGLGRLWQMFAYHGGPFVLEVVLAITQGTPLPNWIMPTQTDDGSAAEARLRLLVRLLIGANQARSAADLLALVDEYDQAASVDRAMFGDAAGLRADLRYVRCALEFEVAQSVSRNRKKGRRPKVPTTSMPDRQRRSKIAADLAKPAPIMVTSV